MTMGCFAFFFALFTSLPRPLQGHLLNAFFGWFLPPSTLRNDLTFSTSNAFVSAQHWQIDWPGFVGLMGFFAFGALLVEAFACVVGLVYEVLYLRLCRRFPQVRRWMHLSSDLLSTPLEQALAAGCTQQEILSLVNRTVYRHSPQFKQDWMNAASREERQQLLKKEATIL